MTKPGSILGEKIAAPPCYGNEPLVEERFFFPPIGRSTKVRTIYAANIRSFTQNKEHNERFPGILYENGGVGWDNPNKSVHARSHPMENRKNISVGRNIGTTRVMRSGCKINYLRKRRRRQRLAAHKNGKMLAPNKPRFEDTFLISPGVSSKVLTLPPVYLYDVMNEEYKDGSPIAVMELSMRISVVVVTPHEPVLCNCDRAQHISNEKKIALSVPNKPLFNLTREFDGLIAPGVRVKGRTFYAANFSSLMNEEKPFARSPHR